MTRLRLVLVDDHEDSLEILNFFIEQLPQYQIVDICRNGEELIHSVMKTDPDLILLDINMPEKNGIDAIRACLTIKQDLLFIFITSFSEYAVEAFELNAVDYLVKPVEKNRLYAALRKATRLKNSTSSQAQPARLMLKDNHGASFVPTQEIIMVEKIGKKCYVWTANKTYVSNENIRDILGQLPSETFFLCHRSYIINLTKLTHIAISEQTYLAYFANTEKHAHISKLKIDELQSRLKTLQL